MGELIAWIIGWDLILEYAFGAVTVATRGRATSSACCTRRSASRSSDTDAPLHKGPGSRSCSTTAHTALGLWNIPAAFIGLIVAAILYRGISESALGQQPHRRRQGDDRAACSSSSASALISQRQPVREPRRDRASLALVPAHRSRSCCNGNAVQPPTAGAWRRAHRRRRRLLRLHRLRRGLDDRAGSARTRSATCRSASSARSSSARSSTSWWRSSLTGVVNYKELGVPDPIAVGIDRIVELRGWSPRRADAFTFVDQARRARGPHLRHPRHDDGADAHLLRDAQGRPAAVVRRASTRSYGTPDIATIADRRASWRSAAASCR